MQGRGSNRLRFEIWQVLLRLSFSLTRFGEILPLGQTLKSLRQNFLGFILYLAKFLTYFGNSNDFWATSSYWVAKLERSIRERTVFFIFSEVLYDEACVSFGAKLFKPLEEVVVDMTYLYYLKGQGNRNDTNEWIIRQAKYSSLKNSGNPDYIVFIFYYGVITIAISRFSYFGCFAWTKHWIQSMSCYFAMECFYLEFLGDSESGHDKTSFLGLKWVPSEAFVRSWDYGFFLENLTSVSVRAEFFVSKSRDLCPKRWLLGW